MRRKDVAKLFNVSIQTVRNWERQGHLRPTTERYVDAQGDTRTRTVYDSVEVQEWKAKWKPSKRAGRRESARTGLQHAKAFELFKLGYDAWDVVRICKIDCDTALDLAQKFFQGPHATLEQKRIRQQEAETERWRKEMNERYRRERHEEHLRELALLRTRSPAPIILTRVEGATALPDPESEEHEPTGERRARDRTQRP